MPRYFFNVFDGHSSPDQEGTDLPGLDEVRVMAIKLTGEILRDEAEGITFSDTWGVQVVDEAGEHVFEIQVHLGRPPMEPQLVH